jgi:hypothetical protein
MEAIEGVWIAVHATSGIPFVMHPLSKSFHPAPIHPSRARPCKQLISFNLAS